MFAALWASRIACVICLSTACVAGCQAKREVDEAQDEAQSAKRLNFSTLKAEHDARRDAYLDELRAARSSAEKASKVSHEFSEYLFSAVDKMLKIAESEPPGPHGLDAAEWIISHCDSGYGPHVKAAELLLVRQPHPENLPADLYSHFDGYEPVYERLLRLGTQSNPSREARAHATFELANLLTSRADMRNTIDATPELDRERLENLGASTVEYLKSSKPGGDRAEARELYELVEREYADIAYRNLTLGELAHERLLPFTQGYPEIGKPAPNIDANDLDGQRLTLQSLRGKVVVVAFWASWCGACLDRIPEENELAEEFADADFVFMGVNGDRTIEDARRTVQHKPIRFNSWWDDPETEESIVARWGVTAWPTTFVLDKSGTIRFKNLKAPELRRAINELLGSEDASALSASPR